MCVRLATGQITTVKLDQLESFGSTFLVQQGEYLLNFDLSSYKRGRLPHQGQGGREEGGQGLTGRPGHPSTANGQSFMLSR